MCGCRVILTCCECKERNWLSEDQYRESGLGYEGEWSSLFDGQLSIRGAYSRLSQMSSCAGRPALLPRLPIEGGGGAYERRAEIDGLNGMEWNSGEKLALQGKFGVRFP